MSGLSIAGRDAAPWVTDFLNAAYLPPAGRRARGRRPARWRSASSPPTGTARPGAPAACCRPARLPPGLRPRALRHRGVARAARCAAPSCCPAPRTAGRVVPGGLRRRRAARLGHRVPDRRGARRLRPRPAPGDRPLGDLTPEQAPLAEQVWHTYPPVAMPSAEGVIAALTRPETWPDYASRSAASRRCARAGCSARRSRSRSPRAREAGRPVFTRGYVMITDLVTPEDPPALRDWFAALEARPGALRRRTSRGGAGGRRAARRLRPHDARRALHGPRPQPAAALHAGRAGLRARRRHLGRDALASRACATRSPARRPSTRSGGRATSDR